MGLLASLLDRVAADEPSEVLVATERPLTLVVGNAMRMLASEISDDDVYAALGEVLTPAQQAELIVARRVDFELVAGERAWRVTAETATDEIIIRAQPQGGVDGLNADEVVVIFPDAWSSEGRGEELEVDIEVEEVAPPIQLPGRRGRSRRRQGAHGGTSRLATAIGRGTICFLRWGVGLGASVGRELHRSVLVVGEGDTVGSVGAALGAIDDDGVVVIAVEDPSPWLPWILRRAEEGRRILIETRATTHEGARRILLGVDASARAEAWLDAQSLTSAELRDGSWSVVA